MIGAKAVNWEIRFADFITENRDRAFQWGVFDCSQFCIQAEKAICDETRWDDLVGGYKTRLGALRRISLGGGQSLWDLIDQRMERKPVGLAKRGDWIGHMTEEGEGLGIMDAKGFWAVTEDGLGLLHRNHAVICWGL